MLTRQEIIEKVTGIICDRFAIELEKIYPESSFLTDLGFDSLDTVELVIDVEDEFGIEVDEDFEYSCNTVNDLIEVIYNELLKRNEV